MSARDDIFSTIRRSLGVNGREATRRDVVEQRLMRSPRGLIPKRSDLPPAGQVALFIQMAEAVSASVARLASLDEVPDALAGFLRAHNLPMTLRHGEDALFKAIPWDKQKNLEHHIGRSDGSDLVGLSHALAGVAETGTLALASGTDNPTTLNFLPDTHIVIIEANDVVGDYESVWDRLRSRYGRGKMPRTLNFVTGPSRSGDIEQKILLGAHGPRQLHILVVG
jgi:L-lactate dehydrogenase complex protein LldG